MAWHCPYNRCEGNGFIYDEATNTARNCECRPAMIAATRAKRLRGRVPKRYEHVSFDTPPVTDMPQSVVSKARRYVDNLNQNLETGRGLWFFGPQGTGKTTLAMLVSRRAMTAGRSAAIYSAPRLLAELRDTFDDDAQWGTTELIDRLTEVDLLQIDDLGAERTSAWVLEQLYAIINARYEAEAAIVVTTNLTREELVEQVGARTVSRLLEMCEEIPLYGDDHRLRAGSDIPKVSPMSDDSAAPTPGSRAQSSAVTDHGFAPATPAPATPPAWHDRREPYVPPGSSNG